MKIRYYLFCLLCTVALLYQGRLPAQVTVTSSDSLSCTIHCTTLTAHVVGDTPTNAGVTADDVYSPAINIGFPFKFYGTSNTQVLLGANGDLCFTISLAGGFDPWSITAPLLGNSEKFNSICNPWCDIDIFYTGTPVGSETYSTDGVAPFRKFVVTWCGCSMFSCGTQLTTTQVIIYETTNIIEVHTAQKPVCSGWNGGHAIVGLQNAAGTEAITAPGRDFPAVYTVPPTEAWRFTPTDTADTAYTVAPIPFAPVPYASSTIYWYNASTGAYIGTGDSITVCPPVTTTYKAGALGCGADTSWGYYTVTPTGNLTITTSATNPTMCGACDGSITVGGFSSGLIDTVTYDLGGTPMPPVIAAASGLGTITITGLCAGTYSNIIGKQSLCSSLPAGPLVLTNPPISISGATTTNPTECGLCNGTITLEGLYPSHVFTVTYDYGGTPQPPVSATSGLSGTVVLTRLCSGSYSNIVASFGSCVTPPAGPYVLTDPPISISGVVNVNPSACGMCDGKLVLSGLYPSHVFTVSYSYNGVAQTPVSATSTATGTVTLTGLCAGVYGNIVAQFGSCITPPVGPYTLVAPPPPVVTITGSRSPSQCGYCDGEIVMKPVTPFTSDTIYYSLNGTAQPPAVAVASFDSTLHFDGLCAGAYSAFSVKIGPCLAPVVGAATLVNPVIISAFSQSIHLGCHGDTVFYKNLSSSSGPLFYIWQFDDGTSDTATNPYHIFAQGVYTVTLTATDHICHVDSSEIDSLVHPLFVSLTATPEILCQNNTVTFTDSSVGTGLSYAWYFGNGAGSNSQNTSYTYTRSGVYTVQHVATDFVPCHDTATAIIQVDSLSPLSIMVTDSVLCRGSEVTFTGIYTTIGNTGVSWNFGDGDSLVNRNPVSHSYDAASTFTVTAVAYYRACPDEAASRVIQLYNSPVVNLGADTSICPGSDAITLTNLVATDSATTWKWSNGETTPGISITAPGTYWLRADVKGCYSTDTIVVLNDCYVNIPNVFTPNGDGLNDYFFPRQYLTKGLTTFSMQIYNRWGQKVFTTTSIDGEGWDGRYNNIDQPVGVYVYVIDVTFKDGQKEHRQGNVTLLR